MLQYVRILSRKFGVFCLMIIEGYERDVSNTMDWDKYKIKEEEMINAT